MQTDKEGRGAEDLVEDDVDEVLDPTCDGGHASDLCSLEEEAVVAQKHQHSKRGSRVKKQRTRPLDTTPATAHRTQRLSIPKPAPRSSPACQFFNYEWFACCVIRA